MNDFEREEFYDKASEAMDDFCSGCAEHENYLEGTYREDVELNLCDECYKEELENV